MPDINPTRLTHAGPRDPRFGYPLWYEDSAGTRLGLGLGPDPRLPAIGAPRNPGAALDLTAPPPYNFPDESFYFLAESRMDVAGLGTTGRARLILALEAAFGGSGEPDPTARIVFSRIRVRIDDVVPGATYTITHPYGRAVDLEADDRGRVFHTEDRGIADEQFDAVLATGLVNPFLAPVGGLLVDVGTGQTYLGDGVSEVEVTGSPMNTNYFEIVGSGIGALPGAADPNVIRSTRFTLQGMIAPRLGVEITAARAEPTSAGTVFIDVHARSAPGQTIAVTSPGLPHVTCTSAGRSYTARLETVALPVTVTAVNVGDTPPTAVSAAVTDRIDISAAEFDLTAGSLTVAAASSEPAARLEVVLDDTAHPLTTTPTSLAVAACPESVQVRSDLGGRASRVVRLVGSHLPAQPVSAVIGLDGRAVSGRIVTLDGSGSLGATSWTWTQLSGPTVALSNASAAVATFIAPAAGERLDFRLSVAGFGGPSSATISVLILPAPPPPSVSIERAEFRTGRGQWRISGSHSTSPLPAEVVVSYGSDEIGRSPVDLTGAWAVRRTLPTGDNNLRPGVGAQVVATSGSTFTPPTVVTIRS